MKTGLIDSQDVDLNTTTFIYALLFKLVENAADVNYKYICCKLYFDEDFSADNTGIELIKTSIKYEILSEDGIAKDLEVLFNNYISLTELPDHLKDIMTDIMHIMPTIKLHLMNNNITELNSTFADIISETGDKYIEDIEGEDSDTDDETDIITEDEERLMTNFITSFEQMNDIWERWIPQTPLAEILKKNIDNFLLTES